LSGTLVVPDDFINLAPVLTFFDGEIEHVTPTLSADLRRSLARALERLGEPFVAGGVYCQTVGPRLETRAEVRMLAQFADVVGMTFGHEATLCNEAAVPVAALCSVQNLAHGLAADVPLRAEDILRGKAADAPRLAAVARALLARESSP
jgi:5'-methylthioadenosine phosphorylase